MPSGYFWNIPFFKSLSLFAKIAIYTYEQQWAARNKKKQQQQGYLVILFIDNFRNASGISSGIDQLAAALVGPVEVLGIEDLAAQLAGVDHIEVFAVGALNVKLDSLRAAVEFAADATGVVAPGVGLDEVLKRHQWLWKRRKNEEHSFLDI